MPKKFATENTKAVTAKEKKKQAKDLQDTKKQQELDEAAWKDDDKRLQKKLKKKEVEEKKKQEAVQRKAERKDLLEKELTEVLKKSNSASKLTQAQIIKNRDDEINLKPKEKKIETHLDVPLEENLNRKENISCMARSIDEAISILDVKEQEIDKHPEKRMKAAYLAFEEKMLKKLNIEKPTLTLSQKKQIIFKEWQKSAKNPFNIHF